MDKMTFVLPVLLLTFCFLIGCGKKNEAGDNDSETSVNDSEIVHTDTGTATDTGIDSEFDTDSQIISTDIFDAGTLHNIAINMPQAEWEALKKNARDEEYVETDVTINGQAIGTVGLRFKGSWGSLFMCFDDNDELICPKLSMKLKFNKYDDDLRFQGLKRLNLHGMARDETLMRDYLGYKLFRDMGVTTSRTSFAEVTVNDELIGIHAVVEQIDGRFTDNRFPEGGNGNLYKEAWPLDNEPAYFAQHLKTNEETAVHDHIMQFGTELANATDETLPTLLSTRIDVNYWMRYIAVNEAINNWDGIMMWYCDANGFCGNHNYYMYQKEETGTFQILPWDLDSTFVLKAWNGAPPMWNDLSVTCDAPVYMVESGFDVAPPSCDPLLRGLALQDDQLYVDAINELLTNYFTPAALNEQIDSLVTLLSPAVERDPVWNTKSWLSQISILKENIVVLKKRLEMIRDKEDVTPFRLQKDAVNDFENTNSIAMKTGSIVLANPESSIAVDINNQMPLNGTNDLRIDVVFDDNGEVAWNHWSFENISFPAIEDFSTLSAIRVSVKADKNRSFGIGFLSNRSQTQNSGAYWAWMIDASAEAQTVELPVADLAYPTWWTEAKDDITTILTEAGGLRLQVFVAGAGNSGFLDAPDPAFVQVDDIEFIFEEPAK